MFPVAVAHLVLVRPMRRTLALAAILLFAFCAFDAHARPPQRILMHTYGRGSQAVVVSLMDILPAGPVRILSSSPSIRVRRSLSHAQFEQMWRTLLASGDRKVKTTGPSKTIDGANNYVFSLADVPGGAGTRFVVPKTLIVPKSDASPAVVAVARQIRGLL